MALFRKIIAVSRLNASVPANHSGTLHPQGRTRIRFSLMPDADAKVLDVRTSRIAERIAASVPAALVLLYELVCFAIFPDSYRNPSIATFVTGR